MKHGRVVAAGLGILLGACGGGASNTNAPPVAPTGVSATVAPGALTVAWDPTATATGYDVYVSPVADRSRQDLQSSPDVRIQVARGTTSSAFTDLPAGTSWFVTVDAFNGAGRSPLSPELPVTLPPDAPGGVAATPLVSGLEVRWDEVPGAEAYDVYLAADAGLTRAAWESCEEGCEILDATPPLRIDGLTGQRPYYALVVARNAGGTSADSALIVATPKRPPPPAVDDLVAEAGSAAVTLSWTVTDPDAVYVLYLALEPGVSKENWRNLEGGQRFVGVTSPFVLEDLAPGTTVYFVVTVLWDGQEGDDSDLASATPNARGTFRMGDPVTVGASPCDLVVADLDLDGVLDAVTANRDGGSLSVCRGQADGQFEVVVEQLVGDSPCALAVGDVNGDGVDDLVVVLAGEGEILVLEGDAEFGFVETVRIDSFMSDGDVRLVDVDGDQDLDLVAVHPVQNEVQVWLGDGEGGFTEAGRATTGEGPACLAVGDLDADGVLDLVVGSAISCTLSILSGDGQGAFYVAQLSPSAAGPIAVLTEDWDGDGSPDVCAVGATNSSAEVWFRGDGGVFTNLVDLALDGAPSAVASGDFDGDGKPEFVVLSRAAGALYAFRNLGSRAFSLRQCLEGVECGSGKVAARDFDGDGILDLLFCAEGSDAIQLLLGND